MHPKSILVIVAALVIVLAAAARQEQPDLAARVTALERDCMAHRDALTLRERECKDLKERMEAAEGWFRSLAPVLAGMGATADTMETQGFAQAGTNFHARETLIAGLRAFARDAKARLPAGPTPAAK